MYQSGFLGINQSLRLVAHTYASGAYKKECLLPPCMCVGELKWLIWVPSLELGWGGFVFWRGRGYWARLFSWGRWHTMNTLSPLTSRPQISYWPLHDSFPGWTHSQERKTFSLPTLVPQEAHRCWTLLRVTDIIIVQLTTTLILFYQLFIDGH